MPVKNVTFPFWLTVAVIVIAVRYVAVFAPPGRDIEMVATVGAPALTVSENVRERDPAELYPVIVYVVAPCAFTGVPERTPVDGLNESPLGTAGEIPNEVITGPEFETVFPVIALPVEPVCDDGVIENCGVALEEAVIVIV